MACSSSVKKPEASSNEPAEYSMGIDREKIRIVIRDNITDIRRCYEKELKVNDELEGKVLIRWEIDNKGAVNSPKVVDDQSDLKNANVNACLLKTISSLTFPPSPGVATTVEFPFWFRNQ